MKYGNRHVQCDLGGKTHTHDSVAERNRCHVLHVKQERGEIHHLEIHFRYPLMVNDVPIGVYEADFVYYVRPDPDGASVLVVEDVKGVRTRDYILKARLMKALYNIEVQEVT